MKAKQIFINQSYLNLIVLFYKYITKLLLIIGIIFQNLEQTHFQIRKNPQLHKYFKYIKIHQINLTYTKEGISIDSHKVLFGKEDNITDAVVIK